MKSTRTRLRVTKMLKLRLAVALLALTGSLPAIAGNFNNSVGFGSQYGGIIGWQGGYSFGNNNIHIGLGYVGIAYGYSRYIGENLSLGLQAFSNQYRIGSALNLNYYFDGVKQPGWMLGVELYRGFDTLEFTAEFVLELFFNPTDFDIDQDLENGLLVSFGYRF